MTASRVVVIGYGNPSRGDDALGPALIERLAALKDEHPRACDIELLTDFQLQVEHAVDLVDRDLALFIDASVSCPPPCQLLRLSPLPDEGYTTHAMSPQAVLHVYRKLYGEPPPAFLLSVRAARFELGEPLSEAATAHLEAAAGMLENLCAHPDEDAWQACCEG